MITIVRVSRTVRESARRGSVALAVAALVAGFVLIGGPAAQAADPADNPVIGHVGSVATLVGAGVVALIIGAALLAVVQVVMRLAEAAARALLVLAALRLLLGTAAVFAVALVLVAHAH